MRIRKRIWIPATLCLMLGSFWFVAVSRYCVHIERDGWVWESSHARLQCAMCSGHMERFECNGVPVAGPVGVDMMLETPVGMVRWVSDLGQFRPYIWGVESDWSYGETSITAVELKQGYYDALPDADERKRGTPTHWCLGMGRDGERVRWVDPRRIAELEW